MRAIGKTPRIRFKLATLTFPDVKNGSGPISSLFMNGETPKPSPAESQALIKIHSFGLNRMDLMQREGKYNVPPQGGKILGVEFSGWVEELGAGDIGDFKVGDEVFGLAYGGENSELQLRDGLVITGNRSVRRILDFFNQDANS